MISFKENVPENSTEGLAVPAIAQVGEFSVHRGTEYITVAVYLQWIKMQEPDEYVDRSKMCSITRLSLYFSCPNALYLEEEKLHLVKY